MLPNRVLDLTTYAIANRQELLRTLRGSLCMQEGGECGLTKNLQAIASKRNIFLELVVSLLHELFLIERIIFHFLAAIEDRCCRVRVQELRTYACANQVEAGCKRTSQGSLYMQRCGDCGLTKDLQVEAIKEI